MRRRALLALAGSSLAGLAGCTTGNGDPTDPSDSGRTATATERRTATETPTPLTTEEIEPPDPGTETPEHETDPPGDTDTTDEGPDGPIDVDLQTVEYVAGAYEVSEGRGIDPDDVVPESEIPPALREALFAATDDGRAEFEDASDEMLAAIDELHAHDEGYVELEGTRYEFEHTFPTVVLELADEDLEEYDEDRLLTEDESHDLDSEAVDAFVTTLTAQGTHIPRAEYRRCIVPPAVESFLESYDYLEDHRGVSRIERSVRHGSSPHAIEVRELTDEDMWGREVVDAASLDDDVVAFIERVLESDHRAPAQASVDRTQYFTDDVPESFLDVFGHRDFPYVRLDGTVYSVGAGRPRYEGVPVEVTVEEHDDDRKFALTVSPAPDRADTEVEDSFTFTARGAFPSVLWVTHDGERHLLESPDYEKSKWRRADGERRPSNQVLETADPADEFAATYTVPAELPAGTYVSRGVFRISWSVPGQTEGEHASYPFELRITVG